ncbi:TnsA endonuclease N-terminal domain-containing protein [Mesobacillus selenatarsenatis]|uniref:Integrase catalytic domain-containing protein n=1 Tax=Mesobacillus selenatarsenatis (strain DSM 18680 / JCM 14380 / FERM P-15431 / SF-1) TaxID=1321606 RepID=A0A0A8X2V1_MESS1|nr:TnsA endonuclease N-terminal domain-containing protein [Mesobacillus selenatarsenatis]GAM14268.1 hypothetical protein SAMD00020551_2417 [Mesobacillus selenatarsenatis SF-1]
MLTKEQFNQWAENSGLPEKAIKEIQLIRNSPPARRVGGGKNNVPGDLKSAKMGFSIQFESNDVELPTVYMMEIDENILEYYDQPPSLKVNYVNDIGRNIGYMYTPDYFVISKSGAYWIEVKTEGDLIKLSQKKNSKYFKDKDKRWRYSPGEEYAKRLGLDFKVISTEVFSWTFIRNMMFLEDYIVDKETIVSEAHRLAIQEKLMGNPGISLYEMIHDSEGKYTADDIYYLVANQSIYVNLNKYLLAEPIDTKIFINRSQNKAFNNLLESTKEIKVPAKIELSIGNKVVWGEGQIWTILNKDASSIYLLSEQKVDIKVPLDIFENYVNDGDITALENEKAITFKEVDEFFRRANDDDLGVANMKYDIVRSVLEGQDYDKKGYSDRTIRDWVKKFNDAQELYGNGFVGLLPKHKDKGNKQNRLPDRTHQLMDELISKSYENIKLKTALEVHRELIVICEDEGVPAPTYQSFCENINNRSKYEQEKKRKGDRAAYKYQEFYWAMEPTVPKHGDRPFEICHIDHTQLDVELVSSSTGKNLGRPWLTLLIDAFTRKILAHYITFDAPSYRSNMMVIRECVKRYNRLPYFLVVDGGKDFHSIYFDTLLAKYSVHKKTRPAAKARFGSVIERIFGIGNKMFIHNLQGNTQIMKNVRQVTKTVNPKNHAVWNLAELNERLTLWIDEVYHKIEHSSLFQSPNELFNSSLLMTGNRPLTYIPYDESFIIMTLPSPKRKMVKVDPGRGIKVNYFHYWNEKFRSPRIESTTVEVRYDPFNLGIVYAYIDNRWEKCFSSYQGLLWNKTEKQLQYITTEIRKQKRDQSRNGSITAKMIATFILRTEEIEDELTEKQKEIKKVEMNLQIVKKNGGVEEKSNIVETLMIEDDKFEFFGEF